MNTETIAELAQLIQQERLHRLEIELDGTRVKLRRRLRQVAPAPAPLPTADQDEADEDDRQLLPVTSEVVGLFHQAATNLAEPLVRQGDQIQAGQVVGFVESMNLNHEVRATQGGTVVEVIASEGEPVEYGQALMLLALEG
ncbi:MAG: acetyl-CoA carboxylase biotin carboxyl carrier protein subunit [Vulcanimicrobiota bacterium]